MGLMGGARLGAVALLIGVQGCLAGTGAGTDAGSSSVPSSAQVQEGDVGEAATEVDQLGRERFPGQYAGIEIQGDRVVVYRRPSAAFDDAIRVLGLSVPVLPRDAPYSARDLQALADRITSDVDHWRALDIEISSVGARHDGTAVEVGTPRPEKLGPLLSGRYGEVPPALATPTGPVVSAG